MMRDWVAESVEICLVYPFPLSGLRNPIISFFFLYYLFLFAEEDPLSDVQNSSLRVPCELSSPLLRPKRVDQGSRQSVAQSLPSSFKQVVQRLAGESRSLLPFSRLAINFEAKIPPRSFYFANFSHTRQQRLNSSRC